MACAYDAEAMASAVTGVLLQVGLTGARYRDACLDICDAVAARRRAGPAGALHALAVVVPPDVRDHARRLAAAAGGAVPAWAGELGQVVPGRCWMVTDSFGESTSLMCEFCYPGGTDRHALMVLRDLAWHGAASSLSVVYSSSPSSRTTSATSAHAWPKRTGHPSTGTRKTCQTTLSATTPWQRRCCGGGTSLCPFPASERRAPKHSTQPTLIRLELV